jgi:hypothetical protein
MGRPGLDGQIDSFPKALHCLCGIRVAGENLISNATNESDIQPSARDTIDHRHLFGDADRIAPVCDGVAEDADPPLAGLSRQNRRREWSRHIHAGRRLVMFVHHHIEAEIGGYQIFIKIAIIEICPGFRIKQAIG